MKKIWTGVGKKREKKYLDFIGAHSLSARYFTRKKMYSPSTMRNGSHLIALLNTASTGKTKFKVKRKILVFCCFRHIFPSWVSPTRCQLYWIPQPLGKLNLNVKRKMLVFLLFPTHFSKLGSRTRWLEVQITTAKSCCFIQDKNIDISNKTTKRKATWGFPIFLRTNHPSSGDLMNDGKVVTIQ